MRSPARPRLPIAASSRSRLVVLAAAAALAVGGCGDGGDGGSGSDGDQEDAEPVGEVLGGSVAQLAQCSDWVKGTEPEKLATIADIRSQVNRQDTSVEAPPLTDEEALELFDNACSETFAKGFRLYVLYARAAGFAPLTRDEP